MLKQLWFYQGGAYYFSYVVQFNVFWFLVAFWRNYYKTTLQLSKVIYVTSYTFFYFILFTLLTNFAFKQTYISRAFYFSSMLVFFSLIVFSRYVLSYLINKEIIFKLNKNKTILLLNNSLTDRLINNLNQHDGNYDIIGYYANDAIPVSNLTRLGSLSDIFNFDDRIDISHVFSTYLPPNASDIQSIISFWEKKGARTHFIPDMKIYFDRPVRIETSNGLPIISLYEEPMEIGTNRIKKRFFDLAFTVFVTIFFLWWLIPLITLVIILTSGFPVFFVQQRTGRDSRIFNCIKFRTMKKNNLSDQVQATKNDERLTLLGKFLRATNLDELPQFWNVFIGDMSVVGPRPHMVKHTEEYRKLVDNYMVRLYLKPGITGLAQVNGLRGELNEEKLRKRVDKDIEYMNSWSLWMDVRIIFRTIKLTLRGDPNAY
jgi:putative colanic acid biosynthesis UDP-glucose lipid carrier transferase